MIEMIAELATKTIETSVGLKETVINALKESALFNSIETIENISLESLKAQNINTINSRLEGIEHPETGVKYVRKEVEDGNGNMISVVVPEFEKAFSTELSEENLQETDKKQFDECNEKLKEAYDNGELDTSKFTERQLEQIKNGDKPEGFTWHHSEVKGRMELVDTKTHSATAHTGGKSIWGGGQANR
jgi:hypothetical protein